MVEFQVVMLLLVCVYDSRAALLERMPAMSRDAGQANGETTSEAPSATSNPATAPSSSTPQLSLEVEQNTNL